MTSQGLGQRQRLKFPAHVHNGLKLRAEMNVAVLVWLSHRLPMYTVAVYPLLAFQKQFLIVVVVVEFIQLCGHKTK